MAITIPAGYLIHQLWFSIFNMTGGYVSKERPNLDYLVKKYRKETGVTPSVRHAYFAWEDWVYGVGPCLRVTFNVPDGCGNCTTD